MLRTDFRGKCIIVQFLVREEDGKVLQRRVRGGAEKRFEEGENPRLASREFQSGYHASAKSFICTHIDCGRAVSGLFAYTSQNRGVGGMRFF